MHCCGYAPTRREWMWRGASALHRHGDGVRRPAAGDSRRRFGRALHRGGPGCCAKTSRSTSTPTPVRTGSPRGPRGRATTSRAACGPAALPSLCLADVPDGPILGRDANNVLSAPRVPRAGRALRRPPRPPGVGGRAGRRPRHAPRADRRGSRRPRTRGRARRSSSTSRGSTSSSEARAPGGIVPARRAAHAARALHAERHRRLPDRRGHPPRADAVRRRRHPRLQSAGRRRRRGARHRRQVKQAVKVATQAAAAVAHRAARLQRPGRDAAHRAPDHPGSRAGGRRDRRLDRHLALLPDARALRRRSQGDGRHRGRRSRQHRHRRVGGRRPLPATTTASRALVDAMLRGGFTPADTAKIVGGNYLRIFAASVRAQ